MYFSFDRSGIEQFPEHGSGRAVPWVIGDVACELQVTHREIYVEHSAFAIFQVDVAASFSAGTLLFEGIADPAGFSL